MRKLAIICVLLMLATPALADRYKDESGQGRNRYDREYEYEDEYEHGRQKHKHKHKHKHKRRGGNRHRGDDGYRDLPPGLQKKVDRGESLPPGWQKKIARGQYLDDRTYNYSQPVPQATIRVLPPLPPGVSYRQIEGDIIKIQRANRKILEVLKKNHIPVPPLPPGFH